MPQRLTDKDTIRRLLNADREWSIYPLADLDEGLFEHCEWWGLASALAMVFRAIAIRPIFVIGDAASTQELLAAMTESSGYLNLRQHQLDAAETVYRFRTRHQMRRMILDDFRPRVGDTEVLGPKDCEEIETLYQSGDGGIAFAPFQLGTGLFRGVRRKGELVAVAGAQVASCAERVAAIGNIFTRPDCRGQGLAQTVTSAVVSAIRGAGIPTIGLNVECANAAAIRAYEKIGFRSRFDYVDGAADRL
ncbi:MAG TPA: GNAT family N-acetyltransferase [Candidatus Sulfopaludibacter sp.]|jgi:predicted GNAT family acetyltransferase|nr:GNAT family N-acetyltransferase [Candidatus Sulfopaludibacter sp.]